MTAFESQESMCISEILHQAVTMHESNPQSVLSEFACELRKMGFEFETLYHAINLTKTHGSCVGLVALEFYEKATLKGEKRYLLSWLTKHNADAAVPVLIRDFCSTEQNIDRWSIGDTLYRLGSRKYVQDYMRIASCAAYGIDRQMIILLLGKLKIENAIPLLVSLLDDECVTLQVLCALGRYKRLELQSYFERFAMSANAAWRRQANKALQKLSSEIPNGEGTHTETQ